jgi:cation diffusion facilitator CzcD-associated flavoprotein CzcO
MTYDAIIIGAGISGLYQLLKLRQLGLNVKVFEAGTGVGGTWYWNRYSTSGTGPSISRRSPRR